MFSTWLAFTELIAAIYHKTWVNIDLDRSSRIC